MIIINIINIKGGFTLNTVFYKDAETPTIKKISHYYN